jgi:hypothetical protein
MLDVVQIEPEKLNDATWRTTYTLSPDLAVLARSIHKHGILSPILVRNDGFTIIDGHERVALVKGNKDIRDAVGSTVPVTLVDCSEQDAMILHVQMNRGRGSVVSKRLSSLVRRLYVSGSMVEGDICSALNMTIDELELLLDGTIIKHRAIKDHLYSRAWVPIESSAKIDEPVFEAPPNNDR